MTHYRGDRTSITAGSNGDFILKIYGNWEPLTDEAKSWLKKHTRFDTEL